MKKTGRGTVVILVGLLILIIGVLTGCSNDAADRSTTAPSTNQAAFPVTIPHAYGETTIERAPKRVVTWGWASADAAIALGTVPVAIPHQAFGGDAQGVLPWIREALSEKGEAIPTVLPDSGEEVPFEQIAAAKPDLVLAPYSGLTESQYAQLSKIAPVVAHPGEAWATPWRETIEIVGKALGKSEQAKDVLADIDAQIAERAAAHPELKGKTVAMVADSAGTFYVYRREDPRVQWTEALGLVSAPSVEKLANGDATFFYTLSPERAEELTSDVLVSFATDKKLSQAFLDSPHGRTMEQVKRGSVAEILGEDVIAAVSPVTALSLPWGLDEYVDRLSAAARVVDDAR